MTKMFVFNGPNLEYIGVREPEVYGSVTLQSARENLETLLADEQRTSETKGADFALDFRQTNDEAEMIAWLHEVFDLENCSEDNSTGNSEIIGVIINPAAFTHYSYAIRDALALLAQANVSIIEVHISNPQAREEFRHFSAISPVVTGTIAGLGLDGYLLAAKKLLGDYNA